MAEWLQTNFIELILLAGGALHTAMKVGEWKRAREARDGGSLVAAPHHAEDDCVAKHEWHAGRREDAEAARHFARNELTSYVPQKLYDRDWKEINRRLARLEGMGEPA